jgi:hypothetical protein
MAVAAAPLGNGSTPPTVRPPPTAIGVFFDCGNIIRLSPSLMFKANEDDGLAWPQMELAALACIVDPLITGLPELAA